MFTLKLFRRKAHICNNGDRTLMHMVLPVSKVIVLEIGKDGHALEIQAYKSDAKFDYETYYVGEPEPGMEDFGSDSLHLETGPRSWWGWGLLENWEGNTSEHYRPASYG